MNIEERIKELIESNPGQMTQDEYIAIANHISKSAPCNLLIFGTGRDSNLWEELNEGGTTLFLEHDPYWVEQSGTDKAVLVEYFTKRPDWEALLKDPPALMMALPERVTDVEWDTILVDAPTGYDDDKPGRMQSIYTSAQLAKGIAKDTHVIVHDVHRTVENVYSLLFLGMDNIHNEVHHLRHFIIKS